MANDAPIVGAADPSATNISKKTCVRVKCPRKDALYTLAMSAGERVLPVAMEKKLKTTQPASLAGVSE